MTSSLTKFESPSTKQNAWMTLLPQATRARLCLHHDEPSTLQLVVAYTHKGTVGEVLRKVLASLMLPGSSMSPPISLRPR